MNCCRVLIVNLQKVSYNSQASVGDRQYTIILFISIIFLPTILHYLYDRERVRHYHFVGFSRPPMPLPPRFQILYYLNDRNEGRYYFCRILASPPPQCPPPSPNPTTLNHLNDREKRGAIIFCRILAPPPPKRHNT